MLSRIRRLSIFASLLLCAAQLSMGRTHAQEGEAKLNEHLAVFQPLVGKTWKGEFANSTAENPMVDISRWERALNGNAVRVTHSVNDGAYGGESILMWDPKQNKISAWYFTTAGFFTQATMDIDDLGTTWTAIEEVTGNENGITQVKSVSQILESGELMVKSQYFANGKWIPGHQIHYKLAPEAEVKFK